MLIIKQLNKSLHLQYSHLSKPPANTQYQPYPTHNTSHLTDAPYQPTTQRTPPQLSGYKSPVPRPAEPNLSQFVLISLGVIERGRLATERALCSITHVQTGPYTYSLK